MQGPGLLACPKILNLESKVNSFYQSTVNDFGFLLMCENTCESQYPKSK